MVVLSLVSLTLGAAASALSGQSAPRPGFELVGGVLLVCGLGLVGVGLPVFR